MDNENFRHLSNNIGEHYFGGDIRIKSKDSRKIESIVGDAQNVLSDIRYHARKEGGKTYSLSIEIEYREIKDERK